MCHGLKFKKLIVLLNIKLKILMGLFDNYAKGLDVIVWELIDIM